MVGELNKIFIIILISVGMGKYFFLNKIAEYDYLESWT
jgi:hypothetical protein